MASKGKVDVLYSPFYGADPQVIGANLDRKRAEAYVAEMKACQPGAYTIREGASK